jgi:AraC-like DNA-binding protein
MGGESMENRMKLKAVQQMQDYIENHISEKITLFELAGAGGYSPWHSSRIFKELTGKAPFDYIRSRRLSCAALKISSEKVKVIDVAFDFVFDSHEGFTRAFSRQFGLAPYFYGKSISEPAKLFLPERVQDSYYRKLQKGDEYFQNGDAKTKNDCENTQKRKEDMGPYQRDNKNQKSNIGLQKGEDIMVKKPKTKTGEKTTTHKKDRKYE